MTDLSNTISELLYEYDCVIIPELGGFITNYRPASINEDSGVLFPPSKALGFNRNLTQNDGLLVNHIASKNNTSFEKASDQIKQKVEACFNDLNEGHRVTFDKVGILFLDEEKSIQFEPDESINYLTSSFGLIEFHYPENKDIINVIEPIEKEKEVHIKEPIVKETPVISIPRKEIEKVVKRVKEEPVVRSISGSSRYRYWAAAALVPLLFYMGLVVWQSDVIKDGNIHKSELDPFKTLKNTSYKARTAESKGLDIPLVVLEEEIILEYTSKNPETLTNEEEAVMVEPEIVEEKIETIEATVIPTALAEEAEKMVGDDLFALPIMRDLPYHVMNGCYGVLSNAEKQAKRLMNKGYNAAILDKKGKLYRVSQGAFSNAEEAIVLLKLAKAEDDPSAWLLKK